MRTLRVVLIHAVLYVGLQFFQSLIHLFAKSNLIELVENGFMESFSDAVRSAAISLSFSYGQHLRLTSIVDARDAPECQL